MSNETTIERVVMRRVRLIRILALIISTAMLAVLASLAGLWGIGKEVWVAHVLENDPDNLMELPLFYLQAFAHTEPLVQVLVVLTLVSFLFLVYEVAKFISSALPKARSERRSNSAVSA